MPAYLNQVSKEQKAETHCDLCNIQIGCTQIIKCLPNLYHFSFFRFRKLSQINQVLQILDIVCFYIVGAHENHKRYTETGEERGGTRKIRKQTRPVAKAVLKDQRKHRKPQREIMLHVAQQQFDEQ